MKWNTEDRSSHFPLPCLQLIIVRDGAEAETKGEGLQTLLGGSIRSRASIHPVSGNLESAVASGCNDRCSKEGLRPKDSDPGP
jgi:hypothetical protein